MVMSILKFKKKEGCDCFTITHNLNLAAMCECRLGEECFFTFVFVVLPLKKCTPCYTF